MRKLTPDETSLWQRVVKTITPLGEPRMPGFDARLQLLNPRPSWVLDLHGQKVYDAFQATKKMISEAYFSGVRRITVITGKSGVIREEFPEWIALYPVQRYELLNGGGAFRIFIAKLPEKLPNGDK